MASLTQTTRYKRKLRRKRAGADAKRARQNQGTTPPFQVHSSEAVANAPAAQLSPEQRASREG
ncbi:MAG: hypothetical protein EA397_05750 [Deltaproteobacteria bacterium]|nr:MAG: hypothetical protein EA397_05750 [Deltaproteobacteria bacterium]